MEQHRRKQHSLMMLVRLRSPLCALSDPILSGVVVVVVGGWWRGWWCGWWVVVVVCERVFTVVQFVSAQWWASSTIEA